jgi:hypothetical protein
MTYVRSNPFGRLVESNFQSAIARTNPNGIRLPAGEQPFEPHTGVRGIALATLIRMGLRFCGAGAFACRPISAQLLTLAARCQLSTMLLRMA